MGRRSKELERLPISRRRWRFAVMALTVPSMLYALVTVGLIGLFAGVLGDGSWVRALQGATVLGRGVIDHIGWIFSLVIALQIGCLLAIIGGQIVVADRQEEAKLRSTLISLSLMPVVALSPAVTVAFIAGFRVGELRGVLFVLVPALVVMASLGALIGTFEVGDDLTLLGFAEERRASATGSIASLSGRPRRRPWAVVLIGTGVLMLLEAAVAIVIAMASQTPPDAPFFTLGAALLVYLWMIPMTLYVLVAVSAALKPATNALNVVSSVLLLTMVMALLVVGAMIMWVLYLPVGIGMVVVVVILVMAMAGMLIEAHDVRTGPGADRKIRWGRNPIAQSGTREAAVAAIRERSAANARIKELSERIDERVQNTVPLAARHRRA